MNDWDLIKQALSSQLGKETFEHWVAPTRFAGKEEDGSVRVAVPNAVTRAWLEEMEGRVRAAIQALGLSIPRITYEVAAAADRDEAGGGQGAVLEDAPSQLNPRYSFDNFVVGSCNQLAHAAALAVAKQPAKAYNPLFIYASAGLGKTHLMHAIGSHLGRHYAGMRIVYTTSERFMNQMIDCIRTERMRQFHQHFRSADVLLIDDIQVIGGKERTQEEFFHTFNELLEHQKQIVISSDSPPKSTPGLVDRLRSRFEWGLMVDIQPPDLETKIAILEKKAEQEGVRLPKDVSVFLASRTRSNVRELEGALTRLLAFSSITGAPITLAMAHQALRHMSLTQERRITIESVARAVADKFSLPLAALKQKSNARQIAYPRQVAMYIARELTRASLPEIGRWFGGKHHTTVLHSIQKIERQRQSDPDLNNLIHSLIDSLH